MCGKVHARSSLLRAAALAAAVVAANCGCVNGFSDSPVCISVSQLTCGDFLTLIAARCRVHISWIKGFWVKHVDSCSPTALMGCSLGCNTH